MMNRYRAKVSDVAKRVHTFRFTVEGAGSFPLDMLRYDGCFPRESADAIRAQEDRDRRRVTLLAYSERNDWQPTVGRWASFNWKVLTAEELV